MLKKIGSLLLLIQSFILAAELNFVASVNKTEVTLNQALVLTVSVEGKDIGKIPAPQLPPLPDFEIGGSSSSQSTNIQIINGKFTKTQSINFIYTLYPKSLGRLTIGACTLRFQDKTYTTEPINITVVKGSPSSSQAPRSTPAPTMSDRSISQNLKLTARVNRSNVYLGEQIIVEFTLYNRLNLNNLNLSEVPSFSGFWVEPLFDAKTINFQKKTINGKLYNVCLLKSTALFPMTTGKLKISPMKLNVEIQEPPRDFFDFFGRSKIIEIESDPVYINVKPLPEAEKPKEFTGAVGNKFTITAELDRITSRGAEPITLKIKIRGTGNIKLIKPPRLPAIAGVKVLDPEVKDNIKVVNNRIKGYKEFNYPIIPQVDGEHRIPSIKIAYFNPSEKKYHLIKSKALVFTATGTAEISKLAQTGSLKILGTDIRYIKADCNKLLAYKVYNSTWIFMFYLSALLIVVFSIIYRRHRTRLVTDLSYARKLRASRRLKNSLKKAQQYMVQNKRPEFLGTISRLLLDYIGDRFNLDTRALTTEQLKAELEDRNISRKLIDRIIALLTSCDTARFSLNSRSVNDRDLLKQVKEVINVL